MTPPAHERRRRRFQPRRLVALCSTAALVVTGAAGAAIPSAGASPAVHSAIPSGITISVGDQNQRLATLLPSSGLLKGAPYKVNFVEFASGPLINAALAAGKIDLGTMGDEAAEGAVDAHLPVKAVLSSLGIGPSFFLVAQPGIDSISQLRGKKVAFTTGTAYQGVALRALATAGLTQKDVQQVNVTLQQLGTVIESGQADASVLSIQNKADYLQQQPKAKVLADNATMKPPYYSYLVGNSKSLANPGKLAAIEDFARRYVQANNWEKAHEAKFIQDYYVDVEHQTASEAKTILAAGGLSNFVPVGKKEQAALQQLVGLLARSGAIPKRFSVAPLFDPKVSAEFNRVLKQASTSEG